MHALRFRPLERTYRQRCELTLSQRAAARIMGYSPSHVSRALKDDPTQKQKVLSLPPAERLTRTIGLPEGVAYFLEDLIPDQTLDK